MKTIQTEFKDRCRFFKGFGVLLLLGGIFFGLLAPLENYCFYLFGEGGEFHYRGFAFGSFMFGNITAQIICYYILAALLLTLGYGHLKLKRCVRPFSLALLRAWLVIGAPLIFITYFILLGSKDLSPETGVIAAMLLLLSYFSFPWLLIRFYRGENARLTLESRDETISELESLPAPIPVLSFLAAFFIVVLHVLMLFNGIYPVLGVFATRMEGIILLDISIAGMAFILWGTVKQKAWAWWGWVIAFGLFAFSTIFTFLRTDYGKLLAVLEFPYFEREFLEGIPAKGYHFALLAGIPLATTWVIGVVSKRFFDK
ncbi:MAG: hypothetical protein HGA28_01360 [Anaerolineaceae bacterium]|nr:hypothetical protein [Anaerolineaceae bacterium]